TEADVHGDGAVQAGGSHRGGMAVGELIADAVADDFGVGGWHGRDGSQDLREARAPSMRPMPRSMAWKVWCISWRMAVFSSRITFQISPCVASTLLMRVSRAAVARPKVSAW